MGWNSWDCYGPSVTEAEVLANAEFLAQHLLPHGWNVVVVDIQWYEPTARAGGYNDDPPVELDGFGRQLPAPNRFPSAAGGAGFGPLAARVHELGLSFGIHIMRGIPRRAVELDLPILGTDWTATDAADTSSVCTWNPDNYGLDHDHPAAQAYYDAQVAQFAAWGVDFIKADDMLAPFHDAEIAAYAEAIRRSGRPIVLSLSPGTGLDTAHLDHLRANAAMWRISDDLWDRWEDVLDQFDRLARWAPTQRPGGWADADMLPLGRIGIRAERGQDRPSRLTADEARTLMTLWVMARSPLMFGGDLPSTDPDTLALLTNPDVLEILKASDGGAQVSRDGDAVLWSARATRPAARAEGAAPVPALYLAAFHLGDQASSAVVDPAVAGIAGPHSATDLWSGEALDLTVPVTIPAHGVRLVRLDPQP
ncbi:glycoside hydrolase family 27 protein [Occultella glacieicola]|uniref:Alpha-galactosidase n=2 Tax=Occultella glacieicola TaxID=2518684 RepID=A0ABY2DY99_9MICO|nr:glycoside hydrolase family 27 protein [Occultella glacieicola]